MIGAIIGDIVGSRFEFNNHRSTDFEFFHPDCKYTDDTVMTLAVADSILSNQPFKEMMREYCRKYQGIGYGPMFREWLMSDNPVPMDSFGNGSAMRVSPCAFLAKGNRERALMLAVNSAICTHNHPEGIKGSLAVTDAILMAQKKKEKQEISDYISELYGYNLDFSIEELRPYYEFNASCQGSVPQAIVAFLESTDFESAIRLAVSLGGDSDTIANITGAIAEAYYGVPEEMKKTALSMLPESMQGVVEWMYNTK